MFSGFETLMHFAEHNVGGKMLKEKSVACFNAF